MKVKTTHTTSKVCTCVNVAMGSYDNQTTLLTPWRYSDGKQKQVGIDNCILNEILYLWSKEIKTLASCCGHGKGLATIVVYPEYINEMYELGYVNADEQPERKDIFYSIKEKKQLIKIAKTNNEKN